MSADDYLAIARARRTKHEVDECDERSSTEPSSSNSSTSYPAVDPHKPRSGMTTYQSGGYVVVGGLDNASRHRVLGAIADASEPVRMAKRRHDYRGGTLTIVADDPELAERIANVIRRALGLKTNGANDAA